jgi:hypothetical protein
MEGRKLSRFDNFLRIPGPSAAGGDNSPLEEGPSRGVAGAEAALGATSCPCVLNTPLMPVLRLLNLRGKLTPSRSA